MILYKSEDLVIILIWNLTTYYHQSPLRKTSFTLFKILSNSSSRASIPPSSPMDKPEQERPTPSLEITPPMRARKICLIFYPVRREEFCQDRLRWSWTLQAKNPVLGSTSPSIRSIMKRYTISITTPMWDLISDSPRMGKSLYLIWLRLRYRRCKRRYSSLW